MSVKTAKAGELREIPGFRTRQWLERHNDVSVRSTVSSSLVFERAEGPYLYDPDGNEYLDFGSPGTNFAGYGRILREEFFPEIQRIFENGLVRFATTDWPTTETIKAKEKIQASVPLSEKGLVWGTRSGGLAIEAAIKALRKARPERDIFLDFWGAFHGRPHGALSLMDPHKKERIRHYKTPYKVWRIKFPYLGHPDPVALVDEGFGRFGGQALHKVSAIFLEIVQGEGGVRIIDPLALRRIIEWCRAYDIIVVVDEIQTGMGRTGSRWCYEQYGILPDIVTLGKALGGNVEDANAMVIRENLSFKKLGQESSTYELPPLEAATAAKSLELLEKYKLAEMAKTKGGLLGDLLKKKFKEFFSQRYINDIRGLGLMWGIEFASVEFRNRVISAAERRGLLLLGAGFSDGESKEAIESGLVSGPIIRLLPPLNISEEQIELAADIVFMACLQ